VRSAPFKQAIAKPKKLGPEHNPWYWNPNRVGALEAPAWFKDKLREVDPDGVIDVRWNPVKERWAVFYRNPRMNHPICQGWTLLFPVAYDDGSYMPLDERTLARLYSASAAKWGNGKEYFNAVQREIEREAERRKASRLQDAIDRAMPSFEHSQIKVAMYGPSSGSKFSTYHA
jgi:hypothetical protein